MRSAVAQRPGILKPLCNVGLGCDTCWYLTRQLFQTCNFGFAKYLWVMLRQIRHAYLFQHWWPQNLDFKATADVTIHLQVITDKQIRMRHKLVMSIRLLSWSSPMALQVWLGNTLHCIKVTWLLARRLWFTCFYILFMMRLRAGLNMLSIWSITIFLRACQINLLCPTGTRLDTLQCRMIK